MSHFSVLVITKTPGELEAALQPFHEFECTGVDDQYVKDRATWDAELANLLQGLSPDAVISVVDCHI